MTRVRSFCVLIVFSLTSVVTNAQSLTSDGVSAMLRGDYQQAAAILLPIVEDPQQRDPAAAFFMATLYDTGRGVPVDQVRACALYQQATLDPNSVYADPAQLLSRRLWMAWGNDWFQECQLVANIGIDHRFQPATFTLGAGYKVEWTLTTATVTYQSQTKSTPLAMMGTRGIMFLPLQYTELRSPASPEPLHFFELFSWVPSAAKWALAARLYEVYRDDVVIADVTDALATVTTAEPPSLTPSDLRTLLDLHVNAQGAVELTVGGVRPGQRIIATRAEKLAAIEKERARAAADARVDWNAALDVNRVPSMTYMEAQGCAHIFLFAASEDRGEVITFRGDARSLQLSAQSRQFDLSKEQRAFSLQIHVYERPVRHDFCSDVGTTMPAESAWQAVSGIVDIELSSRGQATVRILGAEFVGPGGKRIRLNRPIVLTAIVGGVSG